ncbi:hypothetical protein MHL40_10220 [Pseudomonas luteola]|uniref:hypothetical protein n=1 Tax=Pseudomonas luteola TaxID=47886 RepID=UPI001EF45BCC|nr:hypothetical protein [Pseudomonas luteola]MCG7373046.1 hypothetical protein [Pseudomonas luteola]
MLTPLVRSVIGKANQALLIRFAIGFHPEQVRDSSKDDAKLPLVGALGLGW